MKIDKEIVETVLSDYVDFSTKQKIISDIEKEVEADKEPRQKNPKKQFVAIAVTDNEDFQNVPLFLTQIEEGDNHNEIIERITQAAAEHNNTPKGRKMPIDTLGGAIEFTKRKFITEKKVWVKSKEPILIVTKENNQLDFS
jgi:hypothetical protein